MSAYENYLSGKIVGCAYSEEEVKAAMTSIPAVSRSKHRRRLDGQVTSGLFHGKVCDGASEEVLNSEAPS